MKRFAIWTSAALLTLAACGDNIASRNLVDGGELDASDAEPPPDLDERIAYIVNHIQIPTNNSEAQMLGLDIDGDDLVDNALGRVISTLTNTAGQFDVQAQLQSALDEGDFFMLADLRYVALDEGPAELRMFRGEGPSTAPCNGDICGQHFDGATSFSIAADSPTDNRIFGALDAMHFEGSDGKVTLPLPIGFGTLELEVIAAAAVADVTGTDIAEGILGGGVTKEEIDSKLLPAIVDIVSAVVAPDCSGSPPNCCTPGTTGAQLMSFLDEDGDCTISVTDLQENFFLSTLLAPDLDLLDENGDVNPNVDGVLDSMSVGVGFTCVGASFDEPQ